MAAKGHHPAAQGEDVVVLMTLSALAHDAQVTYSPHRHDWLLKISTFGVFSLVVLFVHYSWNSWEKLKTHLGGTKGPCMSHVEFRKYGDVGLIFQMLVAENKMHEKEKKFFSSSQY